MSIMTGMEIGTKQIDISHLHPHTQLKMSNIFHTHT